MYKVMSATNNDIEKELEEYNKRLKIYTAIETNNQKKPCLKQMKNFSKSELYAEYVRLKNEYEPFKIEKFVNNVRCRGDDGEGTRCNICDTRIWGREIWYEFNTCDICKIKKMNGEDDIDKYFNH